MSKYFGKHLFIGIAPDGLAVVRIAGWKRRRIEVLAERQFAADVTVPDLVAALHETLSAHAPLRSAVSFVLSGDLIRTWLVLPPPACSRLADLHASAALRFQTLFGATLEGWKLAARWNAMHPFLAVAAPQALLSSLCQAVSEHDGTVVQVRSQFATALEQGTRRLGPCSWFGLLQSKVLTLAVFQDGAAVAVRCALVKPMAGRDWLEGVISREALLLGINPPEHLVLYGPAPESWASATGETKFACTLLEDSTVKMSDVVRLACCGNSQAKATEIDLAEPNWPRALYRTPAIAWITAVAAAAAIATTGAWLGAFARELAKFDALSASFRLSQRAVTAVEVAKPKPPIAPERAAAVNAAIRQLNFPWRELHDALQEATPATVALLSLEPDAKNGLVHIVAETKEVDGMISYLEQMKRQGWFDTVTLTRHEIDEQDPNKPLRFQIEAKWRQR